MERQYFYTAMYLRLSRDDEDKGTLVHRDGFIKNESGSIANQREIVRNFIMGQPDMELYDIYSDDGYTGSNFQRPEFKRMIADIEAKKVNCVIVKDLSRFGRDYIETGRYIQKIFPRLGVRFIAISDNYDSFFAGSGENSFILPVKNFINESYCRDISVKVKSGLEVKRRNGELVSPFAVYGYKKDITDKQHLVIDKQAAANVRNIFRWKIEGMAVSAIADRLNSLGILSPKEYKKSNGINFNGGFQSLGKPLWSSSSVRRILTNEVYIGHLLQGKTQRTNYKARKNISVPKEKWICVKNTHKAIITEDDFNIVQNLLKADSRKSPGMKKPGRFSCLLFCGGCGEQMVRRVNKCKKGIKVYYICSTKNRGEGCSRHSIEETVLTGLVDYVIKKYTSIFTDRQKLFDIADNKGTDFNITRYYNNYSSEKSLLQEEYDKYSKLCKNLHNDMEEGLITEEEFSRLYKKFKEKQEEAANAQKRYKDFIERMVKKRAISVCQLNDFKASPGLKEIDRHTLRSMVKRIYVYENKRIEIEFSFTDTALQ